MTRSIGCRRDKTKTKTKKIGEVFDPVFFLCVGIPFILDVRLVDVPAGVTQDFSTFLLRCLP